MQLTKDRVLGLEKLELAFRQALEESLAVRLKIGVCAFVLGVAVLELASLGFFY